MQGKEEKKVKAFPGLNVVLKVVNINLKGCILQNLLVNNNPAA